MNNRLGGYVVFALCIAWIAFGTWFLWVGAGFAPSSDSSGAPTSWRKIFR